MKLALAVAVSCLSVLSLGVSASGAETSRKGPVVQSNPVPARYSALNKFVMRAVASMPRGGGYAVNREAMDNLSQKAVRWHEGRGVLLVDAHAATPSFCSSACYLVLIKALQLWEREHRVRFSPEFWKYMECRTGQKDGVRGWGRLNANGPALAKWAHELRAGVNFTDLSLARPGDFLKIFWTNEIGARERGHFVVFLKADTKASPPTMTFWSSNIDGGFGSKTVPLSSVRRMIFTRITAPAQFNAFHRLPETDEWLSSLLNVRVSERDVRRRCGLR